MPNLWMVRAGEGGYLVDDFERAGCVAVGWQEVGDFTPIRSLEAMRKRVAETYPEKKPGGLAVNASMAFKFKEGIKRGDRVVSFDPPKREYLVGTVNGDYEYKPNTVPDYPHIRRVAWQGRVGRDALSVAARNTLGSVLTLFDPGQGVLRELDRALNGEKTSEPPTQDPEVIEAEFEEARLSTIEQARELTKDKIKALSPDDMERLVAALLRAMGLKATVTPKGADRGVDVRASPDGLGFQQPRIMAEVKHRPREAMSSETIRSFAAILRGDDRGLYVSIGGFTQDAKYEAERSNVRITLLDLNELAALVVEHYERFDLEGRALLPLVRVYWPS
jgi:restriction system protein